MTKYEELKNQILGDRKTLSKKRELVFGELSEIASAVEKSMGAPPGTIKIVSDGGFEPITLEETLEDGRLDMTCNVCLAIDDDQINLGNFIVPIKVALNAPGGMSMEVKGESYRSSKLNNNGQLADFIAMQFANCVAEACKNTRANG